MTTRFPRSAGSAITRSTACASIRQIRDVPEDIRRALAARAASRGQSLQSYLLSLVTDEARRSTNLTTLERFNGRDDGSQLPVAEVTQALDQARADRDAALSGNAGHDS